jgi:hypothetical protein
MLSIINNSQQKYDIINLLIRSLNLNGESFTIQK